MSLKILARNVLVLVTWTSLPPPLGKKTEIFSEILSQTEFSQINYTEHGEAMEGTREVHLDFKKATIKAEKTMI